MIKDILENPDLVKYQTSFQAGQSIFLEGDSTQDLYILIKGKINIYKGSKQIAEIMSPGSLFGEMSFLLGSKRTATLKAGSEVSALCIPKDEITDFLGKFPDIAREISILLAQRLDETNKVLYGLKGVCDQIPDAVIMTDKDNRILSWNTAAEKLYGREREQIKGTPVDQIYQDPEAYNNFLIDVQARYAVREKVLKVKHPEKGTLYVSTSTTILHDGHHNFQGVLSIGRDVTSVQRLKQSRRWAVCWLMPLIIVTCILAGAVFLAIPYISKGYQTLDTRKQDLRNQLAKDYLVLRSLLKNGFKPGNTKETQKIIKSFFDIQEKKTLPYTGVLLLNTDLYVINAYSIKKDADPNQLIGTNYGGISFTETEGSIHSVLSLYRTSSSNAQGEKGIEIAFRMYDKETFLGWLIFQMDTDKLKSLFDIDINALKKFRFKKP